MRELVLALVAGLLVATGGPPFPVAGVVTAFAGVVIFAALVQGARARRGALLGLLFGTGTNLVAMSFVPTTITTFTELPTVVAVLALVLLALGQSLPWVVTGALAPLFSRWIAFPLAFAAALGLGAYVPAIFPWTIAAPLARVPVLLQAADVIGERGVAMVLAGLAALAVAPAPRRRSLVVAGAVFASLLGYGLVSRARIDRLRAAAPSPLVALVQQAVPPKERWKPENAPAIAQKLRALTRVAERQGATLAIWPEAAWPVTMPHQPQRDDALGYHVRQGFTIPVIMGLLTDAQPPDGAVGRWYHNATALVQRDGSIPQPSAKMALLAFGESVPLGDLFPGLRRAFARAGGLVPGEEVVLLNVDGEPRIRAGVLNCYEDTLPAMGRKTALAGPNVLVNVTNDAWFGTTAEPELHLLEAIPRAIETRRDLLRAVNTGVTAHVDATGRVVARAEREIATSLLVRPALLDLPPTLYARFGDAIAWGILALLATETFFLARTSMRRPVDALADAPPKD